MRAVWSSVLQWDRHWTLRSARSVSQCLRLARLDLGATVAAASRTKKDQTAMESDGCARQGSCGAQSRSAVRSRLSGTLATLFRSYGTDLHLTSWGEVPLPPCRCT